MKVRLLAPDSVIPNLAIMKISTYHKNKGDDVDWFDPFFDFADTDILYISKVFKFSKFEEPMLLNDCEIIKGGTGYDIHSKLPDEIESIVDLDYSLYPDCDFSIVFTTRGCIRHCPFCIVHDKEGMIHNVPICKLNPKGKHIMLLDNNFFGNPTWRDNIKVIKSFNQPIDYNCGIDLRILTEEQCKALAETKIKSLKCAFDNYEDKDVIMPKLKMLTQYVNPSKIVCYVLVGFKNKELCDEDIERVNLIWSLGVYPFVMVYQDFNDPNYVRAKSTRRFARWCNNRFFFKSCSFEDYLKTRGNRI